MRIALFIPAAGITYPYEFVSSMMRLDFPEHEWEVYFPGSFPMDANRTEAAGMALEGFFKGFYPDTTVWFDTDQRIPPASLRLLLSNNEPIVSGIVKFKKSKMPYPSKRTEYDADIDGYLYESIPLQDGKYKCDMPGMGIIKIDTEVFRRFYHEIGPPFFKYTLLSAKNKSKMVPFKRKYKIISKERSEEVYFFEKVIDVLGYKIWVDPRVRVSHLNSEEVW